MRGKPPGTGDHFPEPGIPVAHFFQPPVDNKAVFIQFGQSASSGEACIMRCCVSKAGNQPTSVFPSARVWRRESDWRNSELCINLGWPPWSANCDNCLLLSRSKGEDIVQRALP